MEPLSPLEAFIASRENRRHEKRKPTKNEHLRLIFFEGIEKNETRYARKRSY